MLTIRPFTAADADGVASIILPIQQVEFGIPISIDDQPDLRNVSDFYQRAAGNFWVAEISGVLVGTIGLLDIGNGQASLRKMFVAERYRGRDHGVAQRLLEALLEWSRLKALAEIYLGTTDKFVAAHRFYEKNGFTEIPKSELPSAFPVMAVDSRFYRRTVFGA